MYKKITNAELIIGTDGIVRLPELSEDITKLDLSECTSLTSLPENLPAGINELYMLECTNLTFLPEKLPAGLTRLNLSRCTSLTSLPEKLPTGITGLSLRGCTNLRLTPELIEKLSILEAAGCIIVYPRHFNQSEQAKEAEEKLELAITLYAKANPKLPKPEFIKELLHRFLTEGIGQRGGPQAANVKECLKEIVATTAPILDFFTQNPNHLKFADNIASVFLDGCVNQPVAGWSEISAWASIAQAPEVIDKIAATKHLIALGKIVNYVATLPKNQKPGAEVEVEAGNALFREVHKKLLSEGDIDQAWLGVPKSIAYEGSISSWLTKEKINEAYNEVKNSILMSQADMARFLLEGHHRETWAEVAFPAQLAEIKDFYEKIADFLSNAIEEKSGSSKPNLEADNEILESIKKYFNEDNLLEKTTEELQELLNNLPNERDEAIIKKAIELTNAPLAKNIVEASSSSLLNNEESMKKNDSALQNNNLDSTNTKTGITPSAEVTDAISYTPLTQNVIGKYQR